MNGKSHTEELIANANATQAFADLVGSIDRIYVSYLLRRTAEVAQRAAEEAKASGVHSGQSPGSSAFMEIANKVAGADKDQRDAAGTDEETGRTISRFANALIYGYGAKGKAGEAVALKSIGEFLSLYADERYTVGVTPEERQTYELIATEFDRYAESISKTHGPEGGPSGQDQPISTPNDRDEDNDPPAVKDTPVFDPVKQGVFPRSTPLTHAGRRTAPCPSCERNTLWDSYKAILGFHGGLQLPFGRTSTAGKLGKRSHWAFCSECGTTAPLDEEARRVLQQLSDQ